MQDIFNDISQSMEKIDGSDFNADYVELCWDETKSPEPEEIIRRIVEDSHNCYAYHLKKSVQHFPEGFMIRKKGLWGSSSDKARIVTNTSVCKYFEHSFYKVYYGVAQINPDKITEVTHEVLKKPGRDILVISGMQLDPQIILDAIWDSDEAIMYFDPRKIACQNNTQLKMLIPFTFYGGYAVRYYDIR